VFVAIWARVLVPESHHVTQFVHHDPEFVAVLPDADGLAAVPSFPDERATSTKLQGNSRKSTTVLVCKKSKQASLCTRAKINPTRGGPDCGTSKEIYYQRHNNQMIWERQGFSQVAPKDSFLGLVLQDGSNLTRKVSP
jgi:hypothetical protein